MADLSAQTSIPRDLKIPENSQKSKDVTRKVAVFAPRRKIDATKENMIMKFIDKVK